MKRTWQILVPVLMIVLLMITAMGVVGHHHVNANAAASCAVCHMALEPSLFGAGPWGFVLQSKARVGQPQAFLSRLSASETAPRGPPA